jgi:alanyl-tRNA synthetase
MTQRLYYTDAFLLEFSGHVLETLASPRPAVVLDRTAFYPTSGGQVFDTGMLRAQEEELAVLEVAEDENGHIVHFLDRSPVFGARVEVRGQVDRPRRLDHMQQHSGQHVLSAAFLRLFNMATVSFHMGDQVCTIDLESSALSREQARRAGQLANDVVLEDRPVAIRFVSLEEARGLGLRKLPPGLKDELRLIDIVDFDLTACGGTHVRATGQIGPILVRKIEKVKQGVRVEFVCGQRALNAARRDYDALVESASAFSAQIWDLPEHVRRLQEDARAARKHIELLQQEAAELQAGRLLAEAGEAPMRVVSHVFADRELSFVKLLAQKLVRSGGTPVVALLATTSPTASVVFAQTAGGASDMGSLIREFIAPLGGRGGGTRDMAQAGLPSADRLEELLRTACDRLRSASPRAH